jgi:tripartite-type tricarboxylate transporter receptor subunit TctC
VLDALKKAMAAATKRPETLAGLAKAGQTAYDITPEQFQAAIEKDGEMYKGDFKRLNIEPQ